MLYEVLKYKNTSGKEPFEDWIGSIKDTTTSIRIEKRIELIRNGNFGDYKHLENGVYELRFHFGSGYRVYYAKDGNKIIILLCGGDKSTQTKDIIKAKKYYKDYLQRQND
ncbi:MAG: type II toxin-antitoxin system RelE/ParE family toxin [Alphaproteobacteria bacterium]|jgi:putative addiction module killer protein